MRVASASALKVDSPSTTSPMTSLTTSSKRDMCAPFCCAPRSTKHCSRAEKSCSSPCWRMRTIFSISVTPTRERLTRRLGACAWTSVRGGAQAL